MNIINLGQLLLLSAIWGASFLFMRIAVPTFGPVLMIEYRVGFAALFLLSVAICLRKKLLLKTHWKHYMVLGIFNSAIPFLLFAYASQELTASLMSILNATAPIWGVLIAILWSRKPLTLKPSLGLLLGIAGVYLLVGLDDVILNPNSYPAVAAALGAAFSYGIASNYAEHSNKVEPFANAHGSMWMATLVIIPLLPFFPATGEATSGIILSVLALGVVCTGAAYLLYFRLISDIGAAPALTVTYLIPVFGIFWGVVFLNENIGLHTIVGTLIVLSGTALVTNFSLHRLLQRPQTQNI